LAEAVARAAADATETSRAEAAEALLVPGGTDNQIQYNDGGVLGGSEATVTAAGAIDIPEDQLLTWSRTAELGLTWIDTGTLGVTSSGTVGGNDGAIDVAGVKIGGTAPSGNFLRGDGTHFVSSAIQPGDDPDVATETARAEAAEATLTTAIATETTNRTAAVSGEATARASADATNATAISTETTNRTAAVSAEATARNTAIGVETTRAEAAEATNATAISTNATAISTETTNRIAGDATTLASAKTYADADIATEITNRNTAIGVETTRAETAEALLAPKASPTFTGTVGGITAAMVGADASGAATTAVAAEVTARNTAIGVETTRATAAEGVLTTSVTTETTRATTAEGLLAPKASPTFTGTVTLPSGQALIAPVLGTPASGTLTNCTFPTLNQNTSGTAANLSGTPALPNGTTATTQTAFDNSTEISTDAYADNNFKGVSVTGFRDDFLNLLPLTVNTTRTLLGADTPWIVASLVGTTGSATSPGGTFKNPGVLELLTPATAGDGIYVAKNNGAGGALGALGLNAGWELNFIFKLSTTSSICVRCGLINNPANDSDTAIAGMWVEYDTANASANTDFTWVTVATGSATYSTTDSVAADTAFHHIRIRSTVGGTIGFTIDGGTEFTTTSTITAVATLGVVLQVIPRTSAAVNLQIDFVSYIATTGRT
jgi:hypothetical protein